MNRYRIDALSWRMAEVYGATVDQLLINLARHFRFISQGAPIPGSWDYQIRKLAEMGQVTRESERIILEMLGDADHSLQGLLESAIEDGLKDAEPELRKVARYTMQNGAGTNPIVSPRQMRAFDAYYMQSADKLNLVNTVMLESTQQAYASTVADIASKISATQGILNTATGKIVTGTESFNKVLHDSVRKMVNNGLTGFIDHGGRHWTPEAYVAMDMRTTMTNTAREAVFERASEAGVDLYQVSTHDGARPLCYPWQGKVISRSGITGEVEDGDGNTVTVHSEDEIPSFRSGGGLFGVNCGHYPIPFVPGFSKIRPPAQDEQANAREYEESQKQRELERNLRDERRELEVMKAQGATKEEIDAQRQRVTDARGELDSFCKDTGRARRREREYTPVNPTFPDGYEKHPPVRRTPTPSTPATPVPPPTPSTPAPIPQTNTPVTAGNAQITPATAPTSIPTAKPATIAETTDFAGLRTYMNDKYGITIEKGVDSLDFGMVRESLTGFEHLSGEYPEVAKNILKIGTANSGVMGCSGTEIVFNPKYYSDATTIPNMIKGQTALGWWPKNSTIASIGDHETAHGIEAVLIKLSGKYQYSWERAEAWNKCTEAKAIVSEAVNAVKKTEFGKGKLKKDLLLTISEYATSNASEAMAEAFADYACNGTNASPVSLEIVKITRRVYDAYSKGGTTP